MSSSNSSNPNPQKNKLIEFLSDAFSFGCLKGFRYFETYMRGREELILRVYNDRKTPHERGSYTATASITSRYHGKLFLSRQMQDMISRNMNNFNFTNLPPASPCDRELEVEQDKTAFLIAGYARYKHPYVWIRSNHEKMGIHDKAEMDFPLKLSTIVTWKSGEVKVWDIVAELVGNALTPPPANPFAVDHAFFDQLALEESMTCAGAMLSFLWKIYSAGSANSRRVAGAVPADWNEYPFQDLIQADIDLLTGRVLREYQELLHFSNNNANNLVNANNNNNNNPNQFYNAAAFQQQSYNSNGPPLPGTASIPINPNTPNYQPSFKANVINNNNGASGYAIPLGRQDAARNKVSVMSFLPARN